MLKYKIDMLQKLDANSPGNVMLLMADAMQDRAKFIPTWDGGHFERRFGGIGNNDVTEPVMRSSGTAIKSILQEIEQTIVTDIIVLEVGAGSLPYYRSIPLS